MEWGHGGNGDEDGIQSLSEEMGLKEVKESFLTYLRREKKKDEYWINKSETEGQDIPKLFFSSQKQ